MADGRTNQERLNDMEKTVSDLGNTLAATNKMLMTMSKSNAQGENNSNGGVTSQEFKRTHRLYDNDDLIEFDDWTT